MVNFTVFALVAVFLVAGTHAQTQVKVGNIANVQVAPDGSTRVQAPAGTDVVVQPNTGVKVDAAGTKTVASTRTGATSVTAPGTNVDVKAKGGVVPPTPEKSKAGAAAAAPGDKPMAVAPQKKAESGPKKGPAAGPGMKGPEAAVNVRAGQAATVDVQANKQAAGTSATVANVNAPGTTAVADGNGNTRVRSPGATVDVVRTPGNPQPTTTVQTVAGVDVVNSPQGTVVSNIPFVGTVVAPGGMGRKLLRAY